MLAAAPRSPRRAVGHASPAQRPAAAAPQGLPQAHAWRHGLPTVPAARLWRPKTTNRPDKVHRFVPARARTRRGPEWRRFSCGARGRGSWARVPAARRATTRRAAPRTRARPMRSAARPSSRPRATSRGNARPLLAPLLPRRALPPACRHVCERPPVPCTRAARLCPHAPLGGVPHGAGAAAAADGSVLTRRRRPAAQVHARRRGCRADRGGPATRDRADSRIRRPVWTGACSGEAGSGGTRHAPPPRDAARHDRRRS